MYIELYACNDRSRYPSILITVRLQPKICFKTIRIIQAEMVVLHEESGWWPKIAVQWEWIETPTVLQKVDKHSGVLGVLCSLPLAVNYTDNYFYEGISHQQRSVMLSPAT